MKGIILAGGHGTRLSPLTFGVSKQLLPVYNKPMIYYPLTVLMLAGIREILVITTPESADDFQRLLGDGSQWGMDLTFITQSAPRGLAEAFLLDTDFIGNEPVALILGDNIFYGYGMTGMVQEAAKLTSGAVIFAYAVRDPERYGIVEFDAQGKALSLEEKPTKPKSNFAIPGLYFYDNQVVNIAQNLQPSLRGELEITDLNRVYLEKEELQVQSMGRGVAWLDAGTHESLLQASNFVQAVESRQGTMIACPEEVALEMNFIDAAQVEKIAQQMNKENEYRHYLLELIGKES